MKLILVVSGTIFTALGVIGIIIPLLPTTPFLLLAAACYARSSRRFHHWLFHNRLFGGYVRNYLEQSAMSLRSKILALILLWATIMGAVFYVLDALWLRILLMAIAAGVTVHLLLLKTLRNKPSI